MYTQPESLAAYRKTGTFPDGAVLVKEVRTIESAHMNNRPGYLGGRRHVVVQHDQGLTGPLPR